MQQKAGLRVLFALCVAGLAQLFFATKRPAAHYMLPALCLMGTQAVVVCWLLTRTALGRRDTGGRPILLAFSVLVLCAAAFAGWASWRQHEQLARQRDDLLALALEAERTASQGQTVCYYRCSSPVYALSFGNEFCGRFFADALAREHPEALFFDPFNRTWNDFHGPVPREKILKLLASGPLYFRGSSWETYPPEARPPELHFEVKAAAQGEALYQALPAR